MLKNILIISVLILLFCSISKITPVSAQSFNILSAVPDSLQLTDSIEKKNFENTGQNNVQDYSSQVNERFVISTLESIYSAESLYVRTNGNGNFATLYFLGVTNMIDPVLASGEKYGYVFSISVRNLNAGIPAGFAITARPRTYGKTGKTSFYMSAACQVRGADKRGINAGINDPIIQTCVPFMAYELENQMVLAIQEVYSAEYKFVSTVGNGNFGTLQDLVNAHLIDYAWYWLRLTVIAPTDVSPAGFEILGTPAYRETGIYSFYLNQDGILRGADYQGGQAGAQSPPVVYQYEALIKFVMRSLANRQLDYFRRAELGNGHFAGSFRALYKAGLINFDLSNGIFGGYRFEMTVENSLRGFVIQAVPEIYQKGSIRSFYVDRLNPLRGADKGGSYAEETDPVIEY